MHIPVLQKEVLQYLDPRPNENFIDCTIGEAGHALAILEKTAPRGKVLGIDADPEVIKNLKLKIKNFKKRIVLVVDTFANLKEIVKYTNFGLADGILFDLGMSSWHLEESGRGFSFLRNEPLDMRYCQKTKNEKLKIKNEITAERIVNEYPEAEIEKILKEYGEERFAKRIAREIIEARKVKPIKSTLQLVEVIREAFSPKYRFGSRHFATRTFQALRIAVNDELENLKKVLPQALGILKPGGKLVVISFHSLEDRIVKNFLKENQNLLQTLTKKPIRPAETEIKTNPRSGSAKLRAAEKLPAIL